jgi:hypothetical protein
MSYKRGRDHVFLYHGYALALGGYVERNGGRQMIDGIAPAVLPVSGGSSHTRRTGYRCPEREPQTFIGMAGDERTEFTVTADYAESEVYGSENGCNYRTVARSFISNLNINNVVTAEEVEAILESTHPMQASKGAEHGRIHARTDARESRIKGLRIRGVEVNTKRLAALDDVSTYEELDGLLNNKESALALRHGGLKQAICATGLFDEPKDAPDYVQDLCRFKRPDLIRCSILENLERKDPKDPNEPKDPKNRFKIHGYTIDIPDFGRLYIGELHVTRGAKQLNMLRWDLGCDETGGGTGGSANVNGATMP